MSGEHVTVTLPRDLAEEIVGFAADQFEHWSDEPDFESYAEMWQSVLTYFESALNDRPVVMVGDPGPIDPLPPLAASA